MKLINSILDALLKTIMACSAAVVLIVSTLQIISRFVTQLPIGWSQDVLRMAFIYAVFSGAAYCARGNSHINLDIVLSMLPDKTRKIIETMILLLVAGFCAFVAIIGVRYAISGLNQDAPFIPLKMTWFYTAVPVSFTLMAYYYIGHFFSGVKELCTMKKGEKVE